MQVAPAAAAMAAVESHEIRAAVLALARYCASVRGGACEAQCGGSKRRQRDVLDMLLYVR